MQCCQAVVYFLKPICYHWLVEISVGNGRVGPSHRPQTTLPKDMMRLSQQCTGCSRASENDDVPAEILHQKSLSDQNSFTSTTTLIVSCFQRFLFPTTAHVIPFITKFRIMHCIKFTWLQNQLGKWLKWFSRKIIFSGKTVNED